MQEGRDEPTEAKAIPRVGGRRPAGHLGLLHPAGPPLHPPHLHTHPPGQVLPLTYLKGFLTGA
jgi:hypothetical protein